MSGGSFDYLGLRVRPLGEQRDALERMAAKLDEVAPGSPVAQGTRRCLELLDEADRLAGALADTWYGVEWWYSGDWSWEQAAEEIAAYKPPEQ